MTDTPKADANLVAFVIAARLHGIDCDPYQAAHNLGIAPSEFSPSLYPKLAAGLGLKFHATTKRLTRLAEVSYPILCQLRSGRVLVILKFERTFVHYLDPDHPSGPLVKELEAFESLTPSRYLLLTLDRRHLTPAPFGLRWFLSEAARYKRIFAEIVVASFFLQLLGLVVPIASQIAIDKVLTHHNMSVLYLLALAIGIAMVFEALLSIIQNCLTTHTASRMDSTLGARIFGHLLSLPLSYFENRRVGDTVARVREIEVIRQFVTGSAVGAMLDGLFAIIFLVVMFAYSVTLSLITVAAIPCYLAVILLFRPRMMSGLNDRFVESAKSHSFLVEVVSGIHTIKSLAIEPIIRKKWEETLVAYVGTSFRVHGLNGGAAALTLLIQRMTTLAILWAGANEVLGGTLSIGQLIAFQMISSRAIAPVVRLLQLGQDFEQVAVSVRRLGDLMNTTGEIGAGRAIAPPLKGAIRFEEVTLHYPRSRTPSLIDFSLDIKPGTSIGVVGKSGSGKSTLAKLLQGLHSPSSGSVHVDGIDVRSMDPASLRRQIGVVVQENFLFDGTVWENVTIHQPGADRRAVQQCLKLAGADEFVAALPNGLETPIGERGVNLSGGQRQRLAIARTLLSNPRILVLDEATSALDSESESVVQRNLQRMAAGRTVIIIAHRLSTVAGCNEIIVLEEGRLHERGTHDQLLAARGVYQRLHDVQHGGRALSAVPALDM